jgi:hypothetical protein
VIVEYGPDDMGRVRLKVNPLNAGPAPRIHYAEDAVTATESSPLLKDNPLTTSALRVVFLVCDPSGQYETGEPVVWTNRLVLRSQLIEEGKQRLVELFVAPRGEIRYTLDGSEPREGKLYDGPIPIGDGDVLLRAFASADGMEVKEDFKFPAKGKQAVQLAEAKPARLVSRTGFDFDSRATTFELLAQARYAKMQFENVTIDVGQGAQSARIMLGELTVDGDYLGQLIEKVLEKFPPDTPVTMSFRKAHFMSGYDLKQFCERFHIPLRQEDIEQ